MKNFNNNQDALLEKHKQLGGENTQKAARRKKGSVFVLEV